MEPQIASRLQEYGLSKGVSQEGGSPAPITQEPEARGVHTTRQVEDRALAVKAVNALIRSGVRQTLWYVWDGGQELHVDGGCGGMEGVQ